MRAVITRVKSASVSIAGSVVGEIGHGLLILLGVGPDDTPGLCEKRTASGSSSAVKFPVKERIPKLVPAR